MKSHVSCALRVESDITSGHLRVTLTLEDQALKIVRICDSAVWICFRVERGMPSWRGHACTWWSKSICDVRFWGLGTKARNVAFSANKASKPPFHFRCFRRSGRGANSLPNPLCSITFCCTRTGPMRSAASRSYPPLRAFSFALREQSHFKFGEINRFGPCPPQSPNLLIFWGTLFFFSAHFHFPFTKKKKKEAPQAPKIKKNAEAPEAPIFFLIFFSTFFFEK